MPTGFTNLIKVKVKEEKMLKVGRKKKKERKRKSTQTRLPGFELALVSQLLASLN